MALPVFKTGRSLLTQEGSVRLRGASATSRQTQRTQDGVDVAEIFHHDIGARRPKYVGVETAGRDCQRPGAAGGGAGDIVRRIADHHHVPGRDHRSAALSDPDQCFRHQPVPIGRIIPKRAAVEVPPQIEVFEFQARRFFIVAREERQIDIVATLQRVEQKPDAGHRLLAGTGPLQFFVKVTEIEVPKPREIGPLPGDAMQGQSGGEQSHTLTSAELPGHAHVAQGTASNADQPVPTGNLLGAANNMYAGANAGNLTPLDPTSISSLGGSQPHNNMQPFLTLSFCVALQGIFPSRN